VKFSVTGYALLAGAGALFAGRVLLGYPALATLAAGGLALVVAAVAVVLRRPRVALRRTIEPARVTAGEPVVGRLEVRNRSRWPTVGFVAVDRVGTDEVPVPVAALGGGAATTIGYRVPTQRRGRIPLGPLTVTRRDPMGLVSLARPVAAGAETVLWSYPRTHPMRPLPIGVVLDYEGTTMAHASAGSTTFAALREYVAGDDPRHINWRATARTGTLIVREHVDTSEPTTSVVLDARAEALDPAAFEEAVEACASVCRSVESYGRPVDLWVVGEDRAGLIGLGVRTLLDRLAVVHRTTDDDPVRLLDTVTRVPGGGALVVVTGNREPAVVTRLAEQRRRFNPLVVLSLLGEADPGDTGIRRQAGTTVLRARTGVDAAATWNRMVGGG
jgi:uncharacterized protein (DUF58 family)